MIVLSIRNKILAVSLGLILLLGITVIVFVRSELSDWMVAELHDQSIELASHYAGMSVSPLLTEDHFKLNTLAISAAKEHHEIEYAFIMDWDGHVVAHSFGKLFPIDLLHANPLEEKSEYSVMVLQTEKGKMFDIAVPILSNDMGELHFGILYRHIEDQIDAVTGSIMLILLIVLLAGCAIAFVSSNVITKPLAHLIEVVRAVGSGDLSRKSTIYSNDEIGLLAASFNEMTASLSSARAKLLDYSLNLEMRVIERTDKLQEEVTERKRIEALLMVSLGEKELLLKEVHHRVKNNMAVISSLLSLQAGYVDDEKLLGIFKESQNRIRSMALVHDKLYQSEDFSHINLKDYVISLVENIRYAFTSDKRIKINTEIEELNMEMDTLIPCGLIINELITNAFMHAFGKTDDPEVRVVIKRADNGNIALSVADNGSGLPEGFDTVSSKGLGLRLVQALIKQLGGMHEMGSELGTEFRVIFPEQ